ncbi:MAG: tungsten ABC transporter ATP-binding protein [Desulfobacterium sp.]|nr:tungsten ABC transporter ATP-binding protein [Desulfobacterium sp.]
MSQAPIYRIQNLVHQYHSSTVLEIDELTIPKHTIVGLAGPNGSGKTTLLKMLAFIEKPSKGLIWFDENKAEPFSSKVRFQVTYLPQVPYLMKRTVIDNITYGLKIRKDPGDHRQKCFEALSMVGLSGEEFADRKWFELSGGEAQRVALAARLILKPRVLLLDEPTANVDENSSRMIRRASLLAREKWNTTVLIASHDLDWLMNICDDMIYLFQGQLSGRGKYNILFGPFYQDAEGVWWKQIGTGQRFMISRPPLKNSAAVILSSDMHIFSQTDSTFPESNTVRGMLTNLRIEKSRSKVIATILVDGFQFIADLSEEQKQNSNFYPGKEVLLSFNPNNIKWQ